MGVNRAVPAPPPGKQVGGRPAPYPEPKTINVVGHEGGAGSPEAVREIVSQFGDSTKGYSSTPVSQLNMSPWMMTEGISDEYKYLRERARRVAALRGETTESRGMQSEAVGMLGRLARGEDSVVAKQTQLARENAAKRIASQLATQRGGFNPAAMRGAQMSQAGAEAQLGAAGAIGQMQERQAALKNYLAGTTGMRGQDIDIEKMLRGEGVAREGLGLKWHGVGIGEKLGVAGAAQEAERLRLAREFELLNAGISLETGKPVQSSGGGGPSGGQIASYIGTGVGALASIIGAIASDQRVKTNIAPGGPGVQQALAQAGQVGSPFVDVRQQPQQASLLPLAQPGQAQALAAPLPTDVPTSALLAQLAQPGQQAALNAILQRAEDVGTPYVDTRQEVKTSGLLDLADAADILKSKGKAQQKQESVASVLAEPGTQGDLGLGAEPGMPEPGKSALDLGVDEPGMTDEAMAARAAQGAGSGVNVQGLAQGLAGVGSAIGQIASAYEDKPKKLLRNMVHKNLGRPFSQGAFTFSDKDLKKDKERADLEDFLDRLVAYEYEYKDPSMGEGRRLGVMAQDVAKSDMGKEMVMDTPRGLALDVSPDRFNPMVLASLADLNDRLRKVEKKEG